MILWTWVDYCCLNNMSRKWQSCHPPFDPVHLHMSKTTIWWTQFQSTGLGFSVQFIHRARLLRSLNRPHAIAFPDEGPYFTRRSEVFPGVWALLPAPRHPQAPQIYWYRSRSNLGASASFYLVRWKDFGWLIKLELECLWIKLRGPNK